MRIAGSVVARRRMKMMPSANRTAAASATAQAISNATPPGRTITSTPRKPKAVAAHLCQPTASPRISTASKVRKSGRLKATAVASARNRWITP